MFRDIDKSKSSRALLRVFQARERLLEALERPDLHLGSPPPHRASVGRMNARGTSVFYDATTSAVALAEVRPPVIARLPGTNDPQEGV